MPAAAAVVTAATAAFFRLFTLPPPFFAIVPLFSRKGKIFPLSSLFGKTVV